MLTDDDAPNGAGFLDVSGLLSEHTLTPLEEGDAALDILSIGQLGAATVGLSHCHKASHLHTEGRKEGTDRDEFPLAEKNERSLGKIPVSCAE